MVLRIVLRRGRPFSGPLLRLRPALLLALARLLGTGLDRLLRDWRRRTGASVWLRHGRETSQNIQSPLAPHSLARLRSLRAKAIRPRPFATYSARRQENPLFLLHSLLHSTSCITSRNIRCCPCHQSPFRRPHSPAEPTPLSLAWVATAQPPERSLSTPGPPPQRTSNLKRALRRGILWCSLASPSSGGTPRPLISPRRAALRPARHSPRAALRARRSRLLLSKVRCRWGYPTAVSSVPKTPANCRPKGEVDAAGGERHPYLNLFSLLAGLHEMVTPEASHMWGRTKRRRGSERARRSRGAQHGGKGWRRRAEEARRHHHRHRIRRCSLMPDAAQKMYWPKRTSGRRPGSLPGAHAGALRCRPRVCDEPNGSATARSRDQLSSYEPKTRSQSAC